MFSSAKVDINTDASGNATVYLSHNNDRGMNGFLVCLIYTPGNIDTGADLTITTANRAIPIMTKANAGTNNVVYYPRALLNAVADGAAGAAPTEFIPIKDERIKVEIAQGGSSKAGSIEAIVMTNPPY